MIVRKVVDLPAPLRPTRADELARIHLQANAAQDMAALDIHREVGDRKH
jgi:hypothetical protein